MPDLTFAAPKLMLLLALVPLVGLIYLAVDQGRAHLATAFASPGTMPSVAPRRPRWRRHVAPLAYALALAALVVASARPQVTVAVEQESATVLLVTDQSRSMEAEDVEPDRLTAARRAAQSFLERLPDDARAGVVTYDDTVRRVEPPTTDRALARAALDSIEAGGGTATGDALQTALGLVAVAAEDSAGDGGESGRESGDGRSPAAIVLLSDGISRHGSDPLDAADAAADADVPVYTVALGTDVGTVEVPRPRTGGTRTVEVPPDRETLAEIASLTGGRALETDDAAELDSIYRELATRVTTEDEEREVSAAFAGVGALLLALGALSSLRWFGRLP